MATLIPAIGTCASRMTSGERRLAERLEQRGLPFNVRKRSEDFNPGANAIQMMTMKVSKGLEFPVVALPGVGHMPAAGEQQEAARMFYVVATRATHQLLLTVGGDSIFSTKLNLKRRNKCKIKF